MKNQRPKKQRALLVVTAAATLLGVAGLVSMRGLAVAEPVGVAPVHVGLLAA